MKKLLMLLTAAVFMLGLSGQAMADFEEGDLVRVVYHNGGTLEQSTSLGAISSNTTPFTTNILYADNAIDFSNFSGATNADLQVAYFIWTNDAQAWTSGPLNGEQLSGNRQGSKYNAMGSGVYGLARALSGGTGNAVGDQTNANAYTYLADQAGTNQGIFNNFIASANGEENLSDLGSVGYVDQSLNYYSANNSRSFGTIIATIRTWANGTTELNPSAVPVPAAIYLLGSGLLGLVGIRRKNELSV